MTTTDGRRARGARSRAAIMRRAVDLASLGGLESLSIGELAAESGVSKSGVVALFGAKEELQLATVAAAREVFTASVVTPALAAPRGILRLRALLEAWLDYSEGRVFAGGCFFAAARIDFDSRPGPVRDALAEALRDWHGFIERAITMAIERDELPGNTDAAQLAFELTALLDGANAASLLFDSAEPYARARTAIARLIG